MAPTESGHHCPSEAELDCFAAGELSADARAAMERHLDECHEPLALFMVRMRSAASPRFGRSNGWRSRCTV